MKWYSGLITHLEVESQHLILPNAQCYAEETHSSILAASQNNQMPELALSHTPGCKWHPAEFDRDAEMISIVQDLLKPFARYPSQVQIRHVIDPLFLHQKIDIIHPQRRKLLIRPLNCHQQPPKADVSLTVSH